ncbi:MAG: hypothetical protein Kow0089_24250 [Desulfobulbaceae bacterium]
MKTLIDYLRDRLQTVIRGCYLLLALVLAFSLLVDTSHAHTWVEKNIPFFWSLFGFAAAAIIIGAARWFGHSGIMVRSDFYDDNGSCGCATSDTGPSEQE